MTTPKQAMAISELARTFNERFPDVAPRWRTVGREAEHPIVWPDGSAADASLLWEGLAKGWKHEVKREGDLIVGLESPDLSYAAEVGKGTIEIITGPRNDLHALRALHEEAMGRLMEVTRAAGILVLGYGIQPFTPASPELMTPKQRYGVLLEALGDVWLWFCLTASDQVHASVVREEWLAQTNVCNLLAPVTVALCANSPIYGGGDSGFCSAREARMGEIHADTFRHGMPARPVHSAEDFVAQNARLDHIMRRENGVNLVGSGTFLDWLETHGPNFDDYLLHEHYIWNSARPRSNHATVELRAACQQPQGEHMAAAALGFSMVQAGGRIAARLERTLGAQAWSAMRAWHHQAVRVGLAAEEPVPGLLQGILDDCTAGLQERGLGEEVYLQPLYARLRERRNPAQKARAAFLQGGVAALIRSTRFV